MGFLRKTLLISTGGLAPVKANSKKERTAKAAEKQVRLQRQMLKQQQAALNAQLAASPKPEPASRDQTGGGTRYKVRCPECSAYLVSRPGTGIKCPKCNVHMTVTPIDAQTATAITETAEAVTPAQAGVTNELERLAELHRTSALSDDEFAAAKARVLSDQRARPDG